MNKTKFIKYMKELKETLVAYLDIKKEYLDMWEKSRYQSLIKLITILIYFTEAGSFDD